MKRIGLVLVLLAACLVAFGFFSWNNSVSAQTAAAILPLQAGKTYTFHALFFGNRGCTATVVSPPGTNGWSIVDITDCEEGPYRRGRVALNVNQMDMIAPK